MMIVWAKVKGALFVPLLPSLGVVLTAFAICVASAATTEVRRDQFRLLWVILALCGLATVLLSRLTRRRGDKLIGLKGCFRSTFLRITGDSRITARLRIDAHVKGGADTNYIFEVTDADGTVLHLGTAVWGLGTDPARMGLRLSAALGVPLADGTPGAVGINRGPRWAPAETTPKDWEDRITGWIRRHWALCTFASVAAIIAVIAMKGGIETRSRPRIEMPCAGRGFQARLHNGSLVRTDSTVSGDVNPGKSEIDVWDQRRGCWAQREVFVDPGHRLTVDCTWVLASLTCVSESP